VNCLCLLAVCWPGVQSTRDNHVFACDPVKLLYHRNHAVNSVEIYTCYVKLLAANVTKIVCFCWVVLFTRLGRFTVPTKSAVATKLQSEPRARITRNTRITLIMSLWDFDTYVMACHYQAVAIFDVGLFLLVCLAHLTWSIESWHSTKAT